MANDMRKFWVRFDHPDGKDVRLPCEFAQRFGGNFNNEIQLFQKDGRSWTIGLEEKNNDIWLVTNWESFKEANDIQYRDSIYFIYKGENVFKVVVFGLHGLEKVSILSIKRKHPVYFSKKMVTKSFRSKMVVPDAFTTKYGDGLENPLYLVAGNEVWYKVTWSSKEEGDNITFKGGWRKLVKDLNIRRNDVFFFKYDWNKKVTFDWLPGDSAMIDEFHVGDNEEAIDADENVRELWTIELTEVTADEGQPLYVPAPVANVEFRDKPAQIMVRLPMGEYEDWTMIYSVARKETKIGRGWYEFKANYKMKPGDFVRFGRVDTQNMFVLEILQ